MRSALPSTVWLVGLALGACQGGSGGGGPATGSGVGSAALATPTGSATAAAAGSADGDLDGDPDGAGAAPTDRGIAELGAIPAWQAVVDRDALLLRRGQHGVVYGVVGGPTSAPAASATGAGSGSGSGAGPGFGSAAAPVAKPALPTRWLIDDSEGNGCLAVRVLFRGEPPADGARVAVGGAWTLDDDRRWYWQADALSPLPPAPAGTVPGPRAAPGHVVAMADPPAGSRPVSRAKDDGIITFQILGTPDRDGDGWRIADELGDTMAALLTLPGEHASYGSHDLRQPDERWVLKKGTTYWVRIGKVRRRAPDQPALLTARTPPVKW